MSEDERPTRPLRNSRFVYSQKEALAALDAAGFVLVPGTTNKFTEENMGQAVEVSIYARARDNRKVVLWRFDANECYVFRRVNRDEIGYI